MFSSIQPHSFISYHIISFHLIIHSISYIQSFTHTFIQSIILSIYIQVQYNSVHSIQYNTLLSYTYTYTYIYLSLPTHLHILLHTLYIYTNIHIFTFTHTDTKMRFLTSVLSSLLFAALCVDGAISFDKLVQTLGNSKNNIIAGTITPPAPFLALADKNGNTAINPYGMVVLPESSRSYNKNDMLISGWNSADGMFGLGNNIAWIRNNEIYKIVTINQQNIPNQCIIDGGLGLTMAMTYLTNGLILQCNLPIPASTAAGAIDNMTAMGGNGCCHIIDDKGDVLYSFNGGVKGPWGATSYKSGDDVYVWISNVLGGQQVKNVDNTGYINRYKISSKNWNSGSYADKAFSVSSPVTVADGFVSMANQPFPPQSGLQNGRVGPSGLAYDSSSDTLYISGTVDGSASNQNVGQLFKLSSAMHCSSSSSCPKRQTIATCNANGSANGGCNLPIGMNIVQTSNGNRLVVPNGGDQNINIYKFDGTLDNNRTIIDGANTAGFLFNAIQYNGKVAFVDDASNSVGFIAPGSSSSSGKSSKKK